MAKKETIIVFSAHSDDYVIGAGGTIAKYAKEGHKVIAIVFSYGEKSHPWLKETIVQKMRSKEALEASKLLGCQTIFFDLQEFKFYEDYHKKKKESVLLKLINKENPSKIFTHSHDDPHPDHQNVNKISLEIWEKLKRKPELYIYSVWNPVSIRTAYPSLYIDISHTFWTKLKALRTFRSQLIIIIWPFFLLMFRALKEGFKIRKKFGEMFYRIK